MNQKDPLSRISISLPETLLSGLDDMVARRGFDSRSQAICDMINRDLNDEHAELGDDIMTGTLNLVYNHATPGLLKRLHELQHENLSEVISSLSVNLTDTHTLSVLLVQGPAHHLRIIADQMISLRGVSHGKLLLSAYILPPVHPLPEAQ